MSCPLCKGTPVLFQEATDCPRCQMQAPGATPRPPTPAWGPRGPLHLVLIACSKEKLDHAAPARRLYCSPLFQKAWAWAARDTLATTRILSARHGLVHPFQELAPYDLELAKLTKAERDGWGQYVTKNLLELAHGHAPVTVTFLAGEAYVAPLRSKLPPTWILQEPLAGLQVGQRLAWFNRKDAA